VIGKPIRPTLAEKLARADVRATQHRIARTSCLRPQAEASPPPLASPPLRSCQYRALPISGPVKIGPCQDRALSRSGPFKIRPSQDHPCQDLRSCCRSLSLRRPEHRNDKADVYLKHVGCSSCTHSSCWGRWQQPEALHPPRTATPALAGRWWSAPLARGDQRGRRQSCARLSRAADAWLCFRRRLKCLAQGFFLGVVKRRPQNLPANALKLRENLVWGNLADQKK